jgi:Winged helix DNA-binding domain
MCPSTLPGHREEVEHDRLEPGGHGAPRYRPAAVSSDDDVRRRRLRAQLLDNRGQATPVEVVRALVGVQAQDRRAAPLALRARGGGASAEAVEHALSGDGSIVRTWAMRGTLHLVAAEDVPLLLSVYGTLNLARDERRMTQLGLPPATAERSTQETAAILAEDGPLTRHELAQRLRDRAVPVAAGGQAPVHVVYRAAMAGVLREVGVRGLEPLYAAHDPGPLPDRDTALATLARRYETAHAPAEAADFGAWSGLPAADVRRAWEAVEPHDEPGEPSGVRLLPAFDEWLLGWASRDFTLAPRHARRPLPGGGIVRPVAIADGRIFATWRLDRARGRVEVEPFGRGVQAGLDEEIEAVLAFAGLA